MHRKRKLPGDPYYDLVEDFDLILASIQEQYGIRLASDLQNMKGPELMALVKGISPKTPLGRIVSIRAETDKEVLKHFTKEEHRIRRKWKQKQAKEVDQEQMQQILEGLKQGFIQMAGGVNEKESNMPLLRIPDAD